MGVYVNEDMPKDCYTCFCYETEFNMCSLTGKRLDNIRVRQDDCPLIEIPQEDEESVLFLARMRKAIREGKSLREFLDGERRADEE